MSLDKVEVRANASGLVIATGERGVVAMALSISFHGRIGAVAFSASGAVLARLH